MQDKKDSNVEVSNKCVQKPINYATQELTQIFLLNVEHAVKEGLPIINVQAAVQSVLGIVNAQVNNAVRTEELVYKDMVSKQGGNNNVD